MFSCMDTAIEHLQLSLALLLITKGEDWIFPMIFFPLIIRSDISQVFSSDPSPFYGNFILHLLQGIWSSL